MKQIPLILIFIFGLGMISCSKMTSKKDQLFVEEFYSDIQGLRPSAKDSLIQEALATLDSTYYVVFASSINGYSVKAAISSLRECSFGYIGGALLLFKKEEITRIIWHPTYYVSDTLFNRLLTRRLNKVEVDELDTINFTHRQLGQFSESSFAFFDIDFDGDKELLIRHPFMGQRFRSAYSPFKESITEKYQFEDDYIYEPIDSFIINDGEYAYFPILDDQTEFDYKNNEIIVAISAGWTGNEKLYYKVENRRPLLCRKEVYYCGYDTLGKRITYTQGDKIKTEYFNNWFENGIR